MSLKKDMEEIERKLASQFLGQPRLSHPDISSLIREVFSEGLDEKTEGENNDEF